ncbi:MAG: hypothetical protein WKF67_07380 [Rubrobacteraceae bacterium]
MQLNNLSSIGGQNTLAMATIDVNGSVYYSALSKDGKNIVKYSLLGGVVAGDILDVEIGVQGAGTQSGYAWGAVGRNGGSRKFGPLIGNKDWRSYFPRYTMAGPNYYTATSARISYDVDTLKTTQNGDIETPPKAPIEGRAYSLPDRPYQSVTPLETFGFETGALPVGWTAIGLTNADVVTGAVIENVYGLRVSSTGGAVSKYLEKTITPTDSQGWRTRVRIVSRPVSGTVRLLTLVGQTSKILGYFYLDSTGGLYAQTLDAAGTLLTAKKLFSSIVNGNILTLELSASGAGTTAGSMSYWAQVGGSGTPAERSLWHVDPNVDFTGVLIEKPRVGGISATSAFTLDIDGLVRTQSGEIAFVDSDELDQGVYQAHAYYPPGTPVRNDRWANGWREVVEPGNTYIGAVDHRHALIPTDAPSYPYSISAYDKYGREYPLGSVMQDVFPTGVTGTAAFAEYSHTYIIPEIYDEAGAVIGCFEVRMSSPGVGEGEYLCQRWSWSPGTVVKKEVKYPASGSFYVLYDTETPEKLVGQNVETVWLSLGNVADVPTGTTLTTEYAGTATSLLTTSFNVDPTAISQRKYAQFKVTLTSDATLRTTPVVAPSSPYVDTYSHLYGQQAAAFLRSDLSEFPGGAFAILNGFPREVSEYEVQRPRGRYSNTPLYAPVLEMAGYTIVAFDEEAFVEIEETINDPEGFVVEAFDRRIKVVHGETDFSFSWADDMRRLANGRFIGRAEADVGGPVDVISVIPMKGLVGLPRIPAPPRL